ncbi:hypothetical protein JCM33774_18000 [Actinophytocola sp. KF-1]
MSVDGSSLSGPGTHSDPADPRGVSDGDSDGDSDGAPDAPRSPEVGVPARSTEQAAREIRTAAMAASLPTRNSMATRLLWTSASRYGRGDSIGCAHAT